MKLKVKLIPFKKRNVWITLALVAFGIFLNLVLSQIVHFFGLPLYFDCVGTILVAFLGGLLPAIMVGFFSNVINAIFVPSLFYYGLVNVLIGWASYFIAKRKMYRSPQQIFFSVLILSVIGGGLGSIITAFLHGFHFGEGASLSLAHAFSNFFVMTPFMAQLLAEIIVNFLDKTPVFLTALLIYRWIPLKIKNVAAEPFGEQNALMMNRSVFRHSLLGKVVIIVLVAEGFLGAFACSVSFFLYRNVAIRNFTDTANGITSSAAVLIDPDKIDSFIEQGRMHPDYKIVEDQLYKLREGFPHATYLYAYRIEEDGCRVVFDLDAGDGVEPSQPGELVKFDPSFEPMLPALFAGEEIDPVVSNDQYGWLLTVYKPIRDKSGKTQAYVAADIAMGDIFLDEAIFFIKTLSLLFSISLIIMSAVIELMKRGVVIPVNRLSVAAMKFASSTISASLADTEKVNLGRIKMGAQRIENLGISSNDEIGHLYDSIATMAVDTYNFIEQVHMQSGRISRMQEIIIMEFAEVVEARDKSTGNHIKKTAAYVEALAKQLKKDGKYANVLTDEYIQKLKRAAPLHDIGKIAVSDLILNKPGKLTEEEFAIMKTHTTVGWKILEKMVQDAGDTFDANYLTEAIDMAHYHHEKWNGSGYPTGIQGEQIPLSARIMAVADVFDALVADRVYKKAFSFEKAKAIIVEGSGNHFDPVIVDAFVKIADELYKERTHLNQENLKNQEIA